MARNRRTSLFLTFFIGLLTLSASLGHAQNQDSPDAIQLEEVAANAQNAGDYEIAISKWEQLISEHPDYSHVGRVEFNCGKCYVETQDFDKAIAHLKLATQKLDPSAEVMLPESYLYLGYAQYESGRMALSDNPDKANQLLTTASQTFATQLKKFENFKHNDQVCYFQGLTYEALDRLEDAAASYEAMFDVNEETSFRLDGLFFLGNVYERLGQYDKALKNYREYLSTGQEDRSFNEVQFRTASTLAQMASETDKEDFKNRLTEAKDLFAKVAEIQDFPFRDDAQYQLAVCSHRLGNLDEAARQYQVLADRNGSEKAAIWAGRNYLTLGNITLAEKYLNMVADAGGKRAVEAAHFLVQSKLNANAFADAFQLADSWLKKSNKEQAFYAELMLDKADAAFMLEDQREQSPEMYLELYNAFPNHLLSSAALYNAAFAFLENNELEKAENVCNDFQAKFTDDQYLPDLLEVRADVHLLKDELDASQKIFENLVNNYQDNPKIDTWKMRVGVVLNMRGENDKAIEWLSPLVANLKTPTEKAEALHWIGASQLKKLNYAEAENQLTASLAADANWRLAPQTMLLLAQAQRNQNKAEAAQRTLTAMKTKFPNARQGIEADFQAAEAAYNAEEFEEAIKLYQSVLDQDASSNFAPYSQFGIAWSYLEKSDFANAAKAFTKYLDNYGDQENGAELAPQALLGRGMSRRQTDDAAGALTDLKKFIDENPEDSQLVEARYELGLAQVKLDQDNDAIDTFSELIKDAPRHKLADHFYYELAWLYSNNDQGEKGHDHFVMLASNFPDSDLTPMAHFKIAEKAYSANDFDEAIDSYRLCLNSGGDAELREKAAYRLGWCFYKQEKYEQARENFALQVKQFEQGRYLADALFMIGEASYNLEEMQEAFDAYVKVKQELAGGGKVVEKNVWLTMLHGATAANLVQKYEAALDFADRLLDSGASEGLKLEGWFEKGRAQMGLKQNDEARESFTQAAADRVGEIGAKARCMIGDLYFVEQDFDKAIDSYSNVFYGYGGDQKNEAVDPWQGYAIYHAARCSYVRIQQAQNDGDKELAAKLASDAAKLYEKLIAVYPDDKFAADAKSDLEVIRQLN